MQMKDGCEAENDPKWCTSRAHSRYKPMIGLPTLSKSTFIRIDDELDHDLPAKFREKKREKRKWEWIEEIEFYEMKFMLSRIFSIEKFSTKKEFFLKKNGTPVVNMKMAREQR